MRVEVGGWDWDGLDGWRGFISFYFRCFFLFAFEFDISGEGRVAPSWLTVAKKGSCRREVCMQRTE